MNAELATVELAREGSIAIATLSGEVDMSNATSVRQRLSEGVTPDDEALVIDLGSLSFIDSAGLHVLFDIAGALAERRQHLRLVVPQGSQVARAVEVVGLPGTISVDPDRAAAIEAAESLTSESRPVPPEGASTDRPSTDR